MRQAGEQEFIYTYIRHVDEHEICRMEMRAFFGSDTDGNVLRSDVKVDPSRSPYMKERLALLFETGSWDETLKIAGSVQVDEAFRVTCLNTMEIGNTPKIPHPKRRRLEREIGERMEGEADLVNPVKEFGLLKLDGIWHFGLLEVSEPVWERHTKKPHMYSTALGTRLARTVANIAAPNPEGVRVIDPCCGIGTVLVEARSMGIDIVGRDRNPLVCKGSRKNLAHFGYHCDVVLGPIAEITDTYDAAIIDMPYNLFTHITDDEQQDILTAARRITDRLVVVSITPVDDQLAQAGFRIVDRAVARKGTFERHVLLCE